MLSRSKLLAATVLAFAGGSAIAATPTPTFLAKAGASDMYEKQSSQLVLGTSKNAEVRRFATMMVSDHTTSTNKVKAAAKEAGVTPPPPALEPKQRKMIADLTAAKGTARDGLYLQQQRMAHQEALALHSDYAATGDKAPLRRAAGEIKPVVQHHIDMLANMK
jgi:putative membrane protein